MKFVVIALLLIAGAVENLVASTHVFGGASRAGQFDPLLLIAFAPLAVLTVVLFAYGVWRVESDRAWLRKARAALTETKEPTRAAPVTRPFQAARTASSTLDSGAGAQGRSQRRGNG